MISGNNNIKKYYGVQIVCMVILFAFVSLYLLKGKDSYLITEDNLDSNIVWFKVLKDNHAFFIDGNVLLNGMINLQPRFVYPSEVNISALIFFLFSNVYYAYVANFFLIHIIAFFGMAHLLLFLRKRVEQFSNINIPLIYVVSLVYATVYFWPHAGISSAGLPLLALAVLRIHLNPADKKAFALAALFCFFSNLILIGIFIASLYAVFIGILFLQKKNISRHILFLIFICVLYAATEYRLILNFLLPGNFISHRTEWISTGQISDINSFYIRIKELLLYGHKHAGTIPVYLYIFTAFFFILSAIQKRLNYFLILAFLLPHVLAALAASLKSDLFIQLINRNPFLKMLQFDRFYFFIPFTLTLAFFFLLNSLLKKISSAAYFLFFIPPMCLVFLNFLNDANWKNSLKSVLKKQTYDPTFNQFYAVDQFEEIKKITGRISPTSAFISLGIHPAVAVFNQIKVLDGYLPNYSLDNKKQIRSVINDELKKSPVLKEYFLHWGNRAYFFTSLFPNYEMYKGNELVIRDKLLFDFPILKKLNCRFLLAARPIDTDINNAVFLLHTFRYSNSIWDVYLYQIK